MDNSSMITLSKDRHRSNSWQ